MIIGKNDGDDKSNQCLGTTTTTTTTKTMKINPLARPAWSRAQLVGKREREWRLNYDNNNNKIKNNKNSNKSI
jgi:hypothetical protein